MKTSNFKDINIGAEQPAFIIAELSANHNQDYDIALKTIQAAKESGADAIKLQTYTPDTMTINCNNEYFKIDKGTLWDGKTLYELYKEAYTPWEWQPKLKEYAEEIGLILFSTAFDKTAVDFLENMNVSIHKVASFEISDIPLIEYMASKGKPIILSTGIAELEEIEDAVNACRKCGNDNIAILKCTSSYPAPIEEANLLTIPDIEKRFNVITGLSDHTLGNNVSIASIALGAKIIERHFILDRKLGGPDSSFSLEPVEFKSMIDSIREVEEALGKIDYSLSDKVKKNKIFARSLFVVKDIKKGELFNEENIRAIRPGYGLSPKLYSKIFGKKSLANIPKGTPLRIDFISED